MRNLAFVSLVLASCTSTSDGAFAHATDAQIARAVNAGVGGDVALASFLAITYQLAPDGAGCPAISHDAQGNLHVQGGCTTPDGTTIAGSATFSNLPDLSGKGNDPTKPSHLAFDGLTTTDATGTLRVDGAIDISDSGATAALDMEVGGIATRDDLSFTCSGPCTFASGATVETDGIGVASVAGSFSTQSPISIDVTMRGADELDLTSDGNCIVYSGAASGRICPSSN